MNLSRLSVHAWLQENGMRTNMGVPLVVDEKIIALAKKYEEELKQHITE